MLPLLPALILLLLNGPAHVERMAEGGALPAALAAIQQRAERPGSFKQARADELMLASLLSLSGDPQVSHALARILSIQYTNEPAASAQPEGLLRAEPAGEPPPTDSPSGKTRDGFLNSQRSRDGPASR